MANIAEFSARYASRDLSGMAGMDEDLKQAFHQDAKAYLGDVVSWLMPSGVEGRRGIRSRNLLSCLGNVAVKFQYVPKGRQVADTLSALGWNTMVTSSAKRHIARTAALAGSFAEASDTLADLACVDVPTTRVRKITLAVGKKTFDAQENGRLCDNVSVRTPPTSRRTRDKDGSSIGIFVGETIVIKVDGTGTPCTHTDTEGVRGKEKEQAGTRELKVAVVTVYTHVDGKGRPITNRYSSTYLVSYKSASDLIPALRREAQRRGYGRIKRVQFIGDGAEWISNLWRQAFKDSILTLDFYHACEYLSDICKGIFEAGAATTAGFKKLKHKLMRYGGATLMRFLQREHADSINALDEKGKTAVKYLQNRVDYMNYGWLRKNHYYIGSGAVESACKFLVAARCKLAGMHWRHKNSAYIAAIRAALRSNRQIAV